MVNNWLGRNHKYQLVVLFLLAMMFVLPQKMFAQISAEDVSSVLEIDKLEHPYLFFTNEDKPEILERIKSDSVSQKIMEGLLAKGHRFLRMPFEEQKLWEPEHPRFGTDREAVSYIGEVGDAALTLGFLYQMTGDEKYAKKGIEFATAFANIPQWINGAHVFDIIYPRVWPFNVPDDQVVFSYDITAAGRARILAIAYDWLYPAFTLEQRDKIRNALLEKAITRVRGNYEFHWWSTAYKCNWSVVCYSGLGITALTLLKESPQLVDVVAESYNRINFTFDHIGEDGGWQEGRGYYGFMLGHGVYFMDALKRLSKGKYNLFQHEKIKEHTLDFELFGLTASFEDSDGDPVGSSAMVNKFTEETGNTTAAWYGEKFIRQNDDIFDILWQKTTVKAIEPEQKSKLFETINWAIMRSDFFDPATVTIATKAGYNDDPHHGHLDIGHFILTYQGVPFINETGKMSYDEFYFNEDRYDYPQAASTGHNVITVNGEQQIIAKKKNTAWKEGIGGEVLDFRTSEKRDYVLMDPTNAYPGKELKRWRRSIVLEKPDITVVLDEVNTDPDAEIRARFFPGVGVGSDISPNRMLRMMSRPGFDFSEIASGGGEYKVRKNYVFLTDGRKHNMVLIPLVQDNDFKIIKDKIATMPVTDNARLSWLQYFETVVKAKSPNSVIATVILPVSDEGEAREIVDQAEIKQIDGSGIEVNLNTTKSSFKWVFEKKNDGYVLKN